MADENEDNDSWLYGGGPDEGSQHENKPAEDSEIATPVKNGSSEIKTYDTFDEHNFEVN